MDAVIAWVDGSDPKHLAKRQAAMQMAGLSSGRPTTGVAETRFSDLGEIYYCIASILKYAPFIRRIHIVSDDQAPAQIGEFAAQGICAPDRIRVVDHREIFRAHPENLPTFNCRTIEALLWNIDGIAEYFLYFNDDFFLNAPLSLEDLVTPDGRLRLEGTVRPVGSKLLKHRLRQVADRLLGRNTAKAGFGLQQAVAARLVGQNQYLAMEHIPHPLRSSTMRDYFADHPAVLRAQLGHPFRSAEQFSPYVLANQLEIAAGRAVIEPVRPDVYLTPTNIDDTDGQLQAMREGKRRYGCVQSLDEFSEERRAVLRAAMAEKFAGYLPEGLDLP